MLKCCTVCGRPSATNRCDKHPRSTRNGSTRQYRKHRAIALEGATVCWICREPFTAANPATADHVLALTFGGSDHPGNLRPAHERCNKRRGAARLA